MKRITLYIIKFLFFLILFCSYHVAYTQEKTTEVVRSSEKVIISGRLYYIHTVRDGQTIYSISRAYGVTEQDIANENPGIILNLIEPGQPLKIPILNNTNKSDISKYDLTKNNFHYHKVKQGQSVYFLSKKYNVPVDIIYKFNPDAKSELRTGEIIKIPRKNSLKKMLEIPGFDEKFIYYKVNENDTLHSISKRYGVPISELINYNNELRWGLKAGKIIKIPKPGILSVDSAQLASDLYEAYLLKHIYPLSEVECDTIRQFKGSVKVAVLLPFFSKVFAEIQKNEIDTSLIIDEFLYHSNKLKISAGTNFIEFYEGALLAIDSLKNSGLSIDLIVRDTERDTNTVKKIISELDSLKPNLIIGPVFPENVELIADFAIQNRIFVISPLSARPELVEDNPLLFQVIPSKKTELEVLANYMSEYYDNNIVLVHNADSFGIKEIDYFREMLFSNFYSDSTFKYILYKEVRFNDTLSENILNALSENRKNLVFVASTDEAYVINAVNNLSRYQKDYEIILIGYPDWQTWRNIDIEYLHNLQLSLYTPFYIDYNNKHTKRFINKSRTIYNYEPYIINNKGFNYSFLGYDIVMYFITALKEFGKDFPRCIDYFKIDLLLSDYTFKRINNKGGFENISIYFLNYNNDLTISKAEK